MATEIRVRGYHLDIYQHVNNARYLEFLEEARWAYFEHSDFLHRCAEAGQAFVVVNININYRKPALMDDLLRVVCKMESVGNKSARLLQQVWLLKDGEETDLVADATVTFCQLDVASQQAVAISGEPRSMLEAMIQKGDV